MSVNGRGNPDESHERDLALVRAVLDGHRDSRETLLARMVCIPRFLARFNARRAVPLPPEAILDAQQETVARVWRDLDSFAGRSKIETWIHEYTRHVFMEALRADRRSRSHRQDLETVEPDLATPHSSASALMHDEGLGRILGVIGSLPPAASEVVRARLLDEESFGDMAERTGEAREALRARYYRAIARVSEELRGARAEGGSDE